MAEHELDGPLAEELYESIEKLETAEGDEGFAAVYDRLATAQGENEPAERIEALALALRAAGTDYEDAVAEGAVTDRTEYLEALGIY